MLSTLIPTDIQCKLCNYTSNVIQAHYGGAYMQDIYADVARLGCWFGNKIDLFTCDQTNLLKFKDGTLPLIFDQLL